MWLIAVIHTNEIQNLIAIKKINGLAALIKIQKAAQCEHEVYAKLFIFACYTCKKQKTKTQMVT